jgi:RHS repeat-associated protein
VARACTRKPQDNHLPRQNLKRSSHRNQQYSITALTDGSGSVVERYAYTAYGQVTFANASGTVQAASASNNRYTYTGREWDEGLSLFHYRARKYDAVGGRFVSPDPLSYIDGSSLYRAYFVPSLKDPLGLGCLVTFSCSVIGMSEEAEPTCFYSCKIVNKQNRGSWGGNPGFSCKDVPDDYVRFRSGDAAKTQWWNPFCKTYECPNIKDYGQIITHGRDFEQPIIGDSRDCSQAECRDSCNRADSDYCSGIRNIRVRVLCQLAMKSGKPLCKDFCSFYCANQ